MNFVLSVDLEFQEVSRATDARIVIANQVFAALRRGRIIELQNSRMNPRRSFSICPWFWDVGGTILASAIRPSSPIR
jgi:hypothetical protein